MLIKLSSFKSRLKHSPEFDKETALFIKNIEQELGYGLKISEIADYDCDLKLVFIETGGSEGLFIQHLDELKEPYYLLTNGNNNSLAASLEILTYLNVNGKKGEILHGSAKYIAERIKQLAAVSNAKNLLKNARLGVIGQPSDWLVASVPDYKKVKETLGITLVDIPLAEVEKCQNDGIKSQTYGAYPEFDKKELEKAIDIYGSLNGIRNKYKLDGLTVRCFDLLSSLKSTGCLALAELNSQGIVATCEGDIAAMLSMYIAKCLTNKSNFQANPSRIDVENNLVTFAHCTVPLDMVDGYRFDTHFESGIGVAVKGEMRKGRVTVFRMSSNLKHYFVSGGTLLQNLDEANLCRTQAVIKLDKPVTNLLKSPCGNHHVIVYGNCVEIINQFMGEFSATHI